jgi:hypothetical protein
VFSEGWRFDLLGIGDGMVGVDQHNAARTTMMGLLRGWAIGFDYRLSLAGRLMAEGRRDRFL